MAETFNVVVEIPRGSKNKYEVDHETGRVFLDRTLFTAMGYPDDYGYIDGTLGEDGDPLDALVMIPNSVFPGCVVECRAVGLYHMVDEAGGDDKVLFVSTTSRTSTTFPSTTRLKSSTSSSSTRLWSRARKSSRATTGPVPLRPRRKSSQPASASLIARSDRFSPFYVKAHCPRQWAFSLFQPVEARCRCGESNGPKRPISSYRGIVVSCNFRHANSIR